MSKDEPSRRVRVELGLRGLFAAGLLLVLAGGLTGCILPEHYSEWQWKQYNPEWKPLPGSPDR